VARRDRPRAAGRGGAAGPSPAPARSSWWPRRWWLGASLLVTLVALGGAGWLWWSRAAAPKANTGSAPPSTYVGVATCATCHGKQHELWQTSDHARAMLPADDRNVLGDFTGATFRKERVTTTFSRRADGYYVRTDGPDGALHDYKVAYTFGVTPLQQYLIEFPNGRYQIPSIAWDSRPKTAGGQRWFHLYPKESIDHRDVLHWTGPAQNWNSMCAECHSTNLQKRYLLAEDRFETTWSDVDVACEACHGPGSRHVEWARQKPERRASEYPSKGLAVELKDASSGRFTLAPGDRIARRTGPPASRAEVETCGRCHARRAPIWSDYQYGQPLAQTYRVALLDDGLYHADGQILDEVYEYGSFLQSKMYEAGVTCSNCHEPHSGRLRQPGNALCAQCHAPAAYGGPQHHFHKTSPEATQCVSCHMLQRTYMVVDGRRDHSFRIPRPDLTVKLATPNACSECHKNRSASWAAEAVASWYGPARKSGWHYGEAIHAGRAGRVNAEGQLTRVVTDPTAPAIVRATALSLLARYMRPDSLRPLEAGLHDRDPLVRRAAVSALTVLEPRRRPPLGVPLLSDPVRSVRLEAVSSLIESRATMTGADTALLDRAIAEYRQAQAANADRVEAHVNLGALEAQLGRFDAAEAAYRTALRIQPAFVPTYLNLAELYRQRGQEDKVAETLERALKIDPQNGDAFEGLGLSLVRQKRMSDAMPMLAKAARFRPDVSRYAYVYAIALHQTGQARKAIDVLTRAHERHPTDPAILLALAEYQRDAGDLKSAAAWARRLAELSPQDEGVRRLVESLEQKSRVPR
jgi:predicted CXXCH cytochrome family protein